VVCSQYSQLTDRLAWLATLILAGRQAYSNLSATRQAHRVDVPDPTEDKVNPTIEELS
jgi:hypothetical protein